MFITVLCINVSIKYKNHLRTIRCISKVQIRISKLRRAEGQIHSYLSNTQPLISLEWYSTIQISNMFGIRAPTVWIQLLIMYLVGVILAKADCPEAGGVFLTSQANEVGLWGGGVFSYSRFSFNQSAKFLKWKIHSRVVCSELASEYFLFK